MWREWGKYAQITGLDFLGHPQKSGRSLRADGRKHE